MINSPTIKQTSFALGPSPGCPSLPSVRHVKCLPLQQLQCEASEVAKTRATSLRSQCPWQGTNFTLKAKRIFHPLLLLANRRVPFRSSLHIQFLGPSDARRRRWRSKVLPAPFFILLWLLFAPIKFLIIPPFYVRGFSSSGIVFRLCDRARWPRRQPPIDLRRKQSIPPSREKCRGPLDFDTSCPNRAADGPCESESGQT